MKHVSHHIITQYSRPVDVTLTVEQVAEIGAALEKCDVGDAETRRERKEKTRRSVMFPGCLTNNNLPRTVRFVHVLALLL